MDGVHAEPPHLPYNCSFSPAGEILFGLLGKGRQLLLQRFKVLVFVARERLLGAALIMLKAFLLPVVKADTGPAARSRCGEIWRASRF